MEDPKYAYTFTVIMGQYEVASTKGVCRKSDVSHEALKYLSQFPNNNSKVVIEGKEV